MQAPAWPDIVSFSADLSVVPLLHVYIDKSVLGFVLDAA